MNTIHSNKLAVLFYDGTGVKPLAAILERVSSQSFVLRGPDLEHEFSATDLEIAPRLGRLRRIIRLRDGGELHSDDHTTIDAWFPNHNTLERLVDRLERNWPVVLASMATTVIAGVSFYFFGLPVLAREVAERLPPVIERKMGEEVMALLDKQEMRATELPTETQEHYQAVFDRFVKNDPDRANLKLHFRGFGGPNAFALPGGSIVFTDDMIRMLHGAEKLAYNDEESDGKETSADTETCANPDAGKSTDSDGAENESQTNDRSLDNANVNTESDAGVAIEGEAEALADDAGMEAENDETESTARVNDKSQPKVAISSASNTEARAEVGEDNTPAVDAVEDEGDEGIVEEEEEFEFDWTMFADTRDTAFSIDADEQFLAVLAHEIGHQKHHHVLRNVLQSSAVLVISAAMTGDVASAGLLTTTIPAYLLQSHYSREFESEADEYAFVELRKVKLSPARFAEVMEKFGAVFGDEEEEEEGTSFLRYASSHPPTPERIARAREAANSP